MRELRYTLVTDGSSDVALIPLLNWLLVEQGVAIAIAPAWADLWRLPQRPHGLVERIRRALDLYPCELLFVHRDAEGGPREDRCEEIRASLKIVGEGMMPPPSICVVPVRMTEAWLLFDESALRRAAGNPNGKMPLDLPRIADLEKVPDPKAVLRGLLLNASGLHGQRLKKHSTVGGARRVAELLDDFSPLRGLAAFAALEADIAAVIRANDWDRPLAEHDEDAGGGRPALD